jgi:hypothetical protein
VGVVACAPVTLERQPSASANPPPPPFQQHQAVVRRWLTVAKVGKAKRGADALAQAFRRYRRRKLLEQETARALTLQRLARGALARKQAQRLRSFASSRMSSGDLGSVASLEGGGTRSSEWELRSLSSAPMIGEEETEEASIWL